MRSRRLPVFLIGLSIVLVILAAAGGRGAAQGVPGLDIVRGLGLPAVDVGVMRGRARLTGSTEALRRGIQTGSGPDDILSDDGSRVVRGRVIVKFREGMSAAARQSA